jgi:putative ABC transport system permease protein
MSRSFYVNWLGRFFRKSKLESQLDSELRFHVEQQTAENIAAGMNPDEARRRALAQFGGLEYIKEETRDARGTQFLESFLQDVRYAARMLHKSPGFAIVAVLTLALGIGATTAIFTVVDRVLLEPLPYPNPNRIVELVQRSAPNLYPGISIQEYVMWRSETRILEDATAQRDVVTVNLLGGEHPEQLQAQRVTANYFVLFGYQMAVGRSFTVEEDVPGGPLVAVITYALWKSRFGSDPSVVGKVLDLDNTAYTVIGVVSPLQWPRAGPMVDVYLPLQPNPNGTNQATVFYAMGRLKPGVTVARADAALKLAADQFRRRYPDVLGPKWTFAAEPLGELMVGGVKKALLVFLGAVGFVLLIACANVANLLLGRETGRQREISIRVALGASRGRIIQQILAEGVLLSLMGGAVGLCLGYAGVRALLAINPGQLPWVGLHGQAVTLDWRVLLFALGISALAGALAGLIPALKASHTNLAETMKESGSRAGTGMRHNKTRSLLLVVETALAMVLLAGAGLLIRTYRGLRSVNPGFDARNVLTMDMWLAGERFEKTAAVAEVVREAEQRLDNLPDVMASAASFGLPLIGGYILPFNVNGRPPTDGRYSGEAAWRSISPGYFRAFHIPLLRGRAFTVNDSGSSQQVVIVNEAMAKQFWPKGGELGTRITIAKYAGPQFADLPREIVGVAEDVRDYGLNHDPVPTVYVPRAQVPDGLNALANSLKPLTWVIRTRVAPFSLSHEIQQQLRIASGGLPVGHVRTMEQVVAHSTEQDSFNMTLLVIFAALALLLAAVGIYGVMAYAVGQRTQEIGIRMALGASPEQVWRTIGKQGMALALVGLSIGVGGGLALTRVLGSLLFGVKPWDPLAFACAAFALALVALLACTLPAFRASRVGPMVALRHE